MSMKCCNKGYKVIVELVKDELIHDIKNTAFAFADSLKTDDVDAHVLHNVFDVGEDGNRDKLARILDSAIEDCREILFRFCKIEMTDGGFDSNEWEDCVGSPVNKEDSYYLVMNMPKEFSKTSIHTITVYIHDYVVNQALYEWLMVVYPSGADSFWALADEKRKKIKEAAIRSTGRSRIKLHPF